MSTVIADSASYRLAEIPRGGPLGGHRVGVPAGLGGNAGLMTLRTADGEIRTAVQVVPLPEVPPGIVAIGDDLAAEWDIDIELAQWTLQQGEPAEVRELVLELPTERDPAEAAKDITRAGLAGELLWVPADGSEITLTVGDLPHRVRHLDAGGRKGVVARLTRKTRVDVYASAVRAGVDIVILADCSGSMGVDDLPLGMEGRWSGTGARWMRRMEALQQALRELLEMRLQISGRVSRIALIEFNHETKRRFPRDGGMAQLDGGSPADVVEQFRNAVALLRAEGGTNIGNALHEAANLLYQHGHAGNERLIVLVSDGADWAPKGEMGSGEMVYAVEEPVSLMAHLNSDMSIRLHAIGISTAELYRMRGYAPSGGLVPNHDLLEELVKVGGGDPTTIGGLDVLADYFSGLGSGITHRVFDGLREPSAAGPLPAAAAAALSRLRAPAPGTQDLDARRTELGNQIQGEIGQCNDHAQRALGGPAWDAGGVMAHFQEGKVTGQPESVARFLAKTAAVLRPEPPRDRADAISDLASPLRRLLDRLAAAARDRENMVAAYRSDFGIGDDTPAAILIDGLTRIHAELVRLQEGMSRLPDIGAPQSPPPTAPGDEPGPAAGFVYKD